MKTPAILQRFERILRRKLGISGFQGIVPVDPSGFWTARSDPTVSLRIAAERFNRSGGRTIVEIGSGIHGTGSGNSMLVWTRCTNATEIHAVDLEQQRLLEVENATRGDKRVKLILDDGICYLRNFKGNIDLLYLDFWVPDPPGELEGTGRANAYQAAFEAASDKMNPSSMILIDDTDHIHPWKHTYIVPLARKQGYVVHHEGRQTLMIR